MYANKEVIKEYNREITAFFINRVKIGSIWAIFFYPLFVFLDKAIYPNYLNTFLLLRGIVEIVLILGFISIFFNFGKKNPQTIAMIQYVILCLSIIIMIHISDGYESTYYAGIVLSLLFLLYIYPLSFKSTLIITSLVLLSYLLPILLFNQITKWPVFINNTTFLAGAIFILNVSSHYANKMRSQEFIARYNLAKANEELKQLDLLKTQFFTNVSHEVRTPLTSIIAPVQSMYHGDVGGLTLDQQNMVAQVYRNALRLLDMINQMLDFSKFDAGKMQLRLSEVNLDETVQDTVAIFEEVTERKGIQLKYSKEGEIPLVCLDLDKVERILTNLLRNAIKFTESGAIYIRVRKNENKLIFEVEDTGIGIPKDHLAHIFKRFQQVDASTTRRFQGTGLGLTIVKESVGLLRGTITVSSEEGKGTTFKVELPLNLEELEPNAFIERRNIKRRMIEESIVGENKRKEARRHDDLAKVTVNDMALIERQESIIKKEEEDRAEVQALEKGDRILLVEDNVDLLMYVSKMLDRFGHDVITAFDGLDGWEHVQKDLPDLIVSDVMMPRMDGYELIKNVKATSTTMHIPIILITAKPELESKIKGLETGADDYLPKPINIRELDARIKNLITMRKFQHALAEAEALDIRMEELSMSFAQSLEIRDFKTGGHSRDVLELGSIIAEGLELPLDRKLKDSLLLHDIGKIGIPDNILLKKSSLSDDEWMIMKKHPDIGCDLLKHFDSFKEVSMIILGHQEHFNGTGYPKGLKGNDIPLIARIIGVADAYHAMTNDRPYRKATTPKAAISELLKHSGKQFDPKVVEVFICGLLKKEMITHKDITAPELSL